MTDSSLKYFIACSLIKSTRREAAHALNHTSDARLNSWKQFKNNYLLVLSSTWYRCEAIGCVVRGTFHEWATSIFEKSFMIRSTFAWWKKMEPSARCIRSHARAVARIYWLMPTANWNHSAIDFFSLFSFSRNSVGWRLLSEICVYIVK